VDSYGWDSPVECSDMAPLLQRKLAEEWTVSDSRVDPSNPQTPNFTAPPISAAWQTASGDFERLGQKITQLSKNK
jgi:hypothetical protein